MIRDGKVKGAYTNTRNTIKSSFGQDKQTEVKDKSDTKKRNGCNCNESPCKNVGYSRESRSAFLKAILERYTI
jgi:hypothetical protein